MGLFGEKFGKPNGFWFGLEAPRVVQLEEGKDI